jgi:hypothetical protein
LLAAALPMHAHGARPLVTDDARIADNCQLESFVKRERGNGRSEVWLLPGCTLRSTELTVGGRRIEVQGDLESRAEILQAKTLLRPLERNGVGFAILAGAVHEVPRPDAASGAWAPFASLIASRSLADDRVAVHANGGFTKRPEDRANPYTWGMGAEVEVTSRIQAIAERYGTRGEPTATQVGMRYWLIKDRFQVDGTLGRDPGARWTSVGIRLLF